MVNLNKRGAKKGCSFHFERCIFLFQVKEKREVVLTPIEAAIEDIQKKSDELQAAIVQTPPDPVMLQVTDEEITKYNHLLNVFVLAQKFQ